MADKSYDQYTSATAKTSLGGYVVGYDPSRGTGDKSIRIPVADLRGLPVYDVTKYGAVANGTNDDTAAINAAIADLNLTGGRLYFPDGHYKATSQLTPLIGVALDGAGGTPAGGYEVLGDGPNATRVTYTGTTGALFRVGIPGDNMTTGKHIHLSDMTLYGNNTQNNWNDSSIGFDIQQLTAIARVTNAHFYGFGHAGLRAHDNTFMRMDTVEFVACKRGTAGGFKSDLWTMINCAAFLCDIGFEFGYYDPSKVALGYVAYPFGPSGTSLIGCGFTQTRIGLVLGGINAAGTHVQSCYWEGLTEVCMMIGHNPAEDWFPGDSARNTAQALDAVAGVYQVGVYDSYIQDGTRAIRLYREAQLSVERVSGSILNDGIVSMMNAAADASDVRIKNAVGPIKWFAGAATPISQYEGYNYPRVAVAAAYNSAGNSFGGGAWSKMITDTVVEGFDVYSSSEYTCVQTGTVAVTAAAQANLPSAGHQLALQMQKWNGSSWDLVQGTRIGGGTAYANNALVHCGGSTLIPVTRGDKISVGIYTDGSASTNALTCQASYRYVKPV